MPTSVILLTEYFTKEAVLYVSLCPHMFLTPEQMFWWDFFRRFDPQPLFKNCNSSSSTYILHDSKRKSRNSELEEVWHFILTACFILTLCSCLLAITVAALVINRWIRRVYSTLGHFRTLFVCYNFWSWINNEPHLATWIWITVSCKSFIGAFIQQIWYSWTFCKKFGKPVHSPHVPECVQYTFIRKKTN